MTFLSTHTAAEANRVWLVPIHMTTGRVLARRIYTRIRRRSNGANVNFRVGLYRAVRPEFAPKREMLGEFAELEFRRLAVAQPLAWGLSTVTSYNADLDIEVELDPRDGWFFVGYQTSAPEGLWLVPGNRDTREAIPGFKTRAPAGGAQPLELPEKLRRISGSAGVADPVSFWVRSAVGAQIFGHPVPPVTP